MKYTVQVKVSFHVKTVKKIKNKSLLEVHERSHSKEKPFACKNCDKRYSRKDILTNHERTHTGETPFSCQYCEMKYFNMQNLRRHEIRIHTAAIKDLKKNLNKS